MTDTDLIVPVEVHALMANEKVQEQHPIIRVKPSYDRMLGTLPEDEGRGAAEPDLFITDREVKDDPTFQGIHVRWQLPEALTEGYVDRETGETEYPLVPNRWLVVRYSEVRGRTKAVGWLVHSDYLFSDDDGANYDGFTENSFLDLRGTQPQVDWLGSVHRLEDWNEPEPRTLFLTAAGAGLPTFAAFQPYHENVFSLHDNLEDLIETIDSYPPDATLSYLVAGWYSDSTQDILQQAATIPGLLPPDSDGSLADIMTGLGWATQRSIATDIGTADQDDTDQDASGPVDCVLDGRLDTWYLSASAPNPGHVTIDLYAEHKITDLHAFLGSPIGEYCPNRTVLQVSTDKVQWRDLQTFTSASDNLDAELVWPARGATVQPPVTARYLRLAMTQEHQVGIRSIQFTAEPTDVHRTMFSGTALGLNWHHGGDAPEDDDRPTDMNAIKVALGHSTGEAAEELLARQSGRRDVSHLLGALYHGTLDTFDGADGDRDLEDVTQHSWFAGQDGGSTWQIAARPTEETEPEPVASASRRALAPDWLNQLNADQAAYDALLPDLAEHQWRLWALWWLHHLPEKDRPDELPERFDERCAEQLEPGNTEGLAYQTEQLLQARDDLLGKLPPEADEGEDPQDAIDEWAADRGLDEHLQLRRRPLESFYVPADPVVVIEGTGGGTMPLTRDSDNPLPCRVSGALLTEVLFDQTPTPPPTPELPPGFTGLPDACEDLLTEFALLDLAVRTPDCDDTVLHTLVHNPATHATGPLAEYTAPWRQPWLPMLLQWELDFYPTPYRTEDAYNWTFQAPDPETDLETYSYVWNGTGTLEADFPSDGNVLNRLFRAGAYLAPTTVYVAKKQLERYIATYPSADVGALRALGENLKQLDVLSQSLSGFNDWLLQLDGGAQVPTEPGIAQDLAGDQNHVPDGAGLHMDRFQPVRAGQFTFTSLRIVDRFGRVIDLVTPGREGTAYEQYPVLTASVQPNPTEDPDLYLYPDPINPERFIQLPPRLLQGTRLAFAPVPAGPAEPTGGAEPVAPGVGSPIAGWLLVNYFDKTQGVYGPTGQALGELRVITNAQSELETTYTTLPHSPYTGRDDTAFIREHPELAKFLAGLLDHPDSVGRFQALRKTIDQSLATTVDPAPEDDQLPARLIGRPVALIRADLNLQLNGPVLTDPSWGTILSQDEDEPGYTDDDWAIRLGDPHVLTDGLIGYFSAARDQDVDYTSLHVVHPADTHDYLVPITNGSDIALPARPATSPTTRHLTLLAHPHLPVHATTGILPVQALQLNADLVHDALANVRASFRLNPLLAPTRERPLESSPVNGHGPGVFDDADDDEALVIPPLSTRYGTWTWAQPRTTDTDLLAWDELGLIPADQLMHPDDPIPIARAGYLQLTPATPDPEPEPEHGPDPTTRHLRPRERRS